MTVISTQSSRTFRNLLKQIDIAHNQIGLRDDRNAQAFVPRQFFETGARDPIFLFGGLVRIGRRADADVFRHAFPFPTRYEYLLAISRVSRTAASFFTKIFFSNASAVQLHEFVRVAGVTVFAGELAAPIGIDRPVEGDARRIALVQDRFHRKQKVLRTLLRTSGCVGATEKWKRGGRCQPAAREAAGYGMISVLPEILRSRGESRRNAQARAEGNPTRQCSGTTLPGTRERGKLDRSVVWATRSGLTGKREAEENGARRRIGYPAV